MTQATKTQQRGHCQLCGANHAVTRGFVAAHGYTVKNGYFQGVCQGHQHAALETDRSYTDKVVASARADAVELRERAAKFAAGTIHPAQIKTSRSEFVDGKRVPVMVAWADAPAFMQAEALKSAAFNAGRRAELAEEFAADLEKLANAVHGQPLQVVTVAAAAASIQAGERRVNENGTVLVAKYQDGARVYWVRVTPNGKSLTGWTGSRAWRALKLAE